MQKSEVEFLEDLRAHIARKYVTQKIAAVHWGLSDSYVSAVVKGLKAPNQKILKEVGYTRTKKVAYEKR